MKALFLFSLFILGGCVNKKETVEVKIDSYPKGATIGLVKENAGLDKFYTKRKGHAGSIITPGTYDFEKGSYYYSLEWPDGKRKFGLIAMLESESILLK